MPQLTFRPGCCPRSCVPSSAHPEPQALQPHCGDMVEFLYESQRGSPPILYNSTLMRRSLGSLWWSGLLIFLVTSEKDAGNYICEVKTAYPEREARLRYSPWMVCLVPQPALIPTCCLGSDLTSLCTSHHVGTMLGP